MTEQASIKRVTILFALLSVVVLGATASARAQVGISAAFTLDRLTDPPMTSNTTDLYGPTGSVYYERGKFLAFGGDVRGSYLSGSGLTLASGFIGPRAAFKFHPFPLQVGVEALGGIDHLSQNAQPGSSNDLGYQLLGNLDLTVFPRLDWRVLEYARTGGTGNLAGNAFSTGLVFRIPFL